MAPRSARTAFTLLELVVVVVIIAILIALLLPAIQAARQAARRTQSMNNLRNIALATQNHLAVTKTFPPLYFGPESVPDPTIAAGQYSWIVKLLPYLEEAALYNSLSEASQKFALPADQIKLGNGGDPAATQFAVFLNPADPPPTDKTAGRTNYIALPATKQQLLTIGKAPQKMIADGAIIPSLNGLGVRIKNITDGTSKTWLCCESREEQRSNWYRFQEPFACGLLPGDTSVENNDPKTGIPRFDGEVWVFNEKAGDRSALNYGPTAKDPKAAYNADEKDPLRRTWGPSSPFSGLDHHAMLDGSVHSIKDTIHPQIYYALITRAGGELNTEFD